MRTSSHEVKQYFIKDSQIVGMEYLLFCDTNGREKLLRLLINSYLRYPT